MFMKKIARPDSSQNQRGLTLIATNHKSHSKLRRQLGSAFSITISSTVVLSVVGYLLVSFLRGQRVNREEEIQFIQAKGLASDVVEIGKYFLAYERVVFIEEALKLDNQRRLALDALMTQGIGSLEPASYFLSNACGGYDADAIEVGDLKVNGSQVMCPFYLRNPLLDGNMVDSLLFRMWTSNNQTQVLTLGAGGSVVTRGGVSKAPIFKVEPNNSYSVELDLKNSVLDPRSARLRLGVDQTFINTLKAFNSEIKLRYNFYAQRSGFQSITNERFVTISAVVKYGPTLQPSVATASETFVIQSPTVKDFAIFVPYPETASGASTKRMSEAFLFGGPNTQVYGRVFFDGDIDIPLQNLPVFHETVVISGDLVNQSSITDPVLKRSLMQEKFKKGLIVNFPADRLIKDGECVSNYKVVNHSEIHCKKPADPTANFRIHDYIQNLVSMCSDYGIVSKNGSYMYLIASIDPLIPFRPAPVEVESCSPSAPGKLFISGGTKWVRIMGSHAFILSPAEKVVALNATNIYGTILGGHISVKDGTQFYTISNLRSGLPGIADANVLAEVTKEASGILAGVGVPLMNLPLFKNSSVGR
jgi:hypothetical protein